MSRQSTRTDELRPLHHYIRVDFWLRGRERIGEGRGVQLGDRRLAVRGGQLPRRD
jgi:hypothetical protein